jgi:hypothetical protein
MLIIGCDYHPGFQQIAFVDTETRRIVAVCNVPEGWTITAENYGEAALNKEGGGRAHGSADFGHDALSGTDLSQLGALSPD